MKRGKKQGWRQTPASAGLPVSLRRRRTAEWAHPRPCGASGSSGQRRESTAGAPPFSAGFPFPRWESRVTVPACPGSCGVSMWTRPLSRARTGWPTAAVACPGWLAHARCRVPGLADPRPCGVSASCSESNSSGAADPRPCGGFSSGLAGGGGLPPAPAGVELWARAFWNAHQARRGAPAWWRWLSISRCERITPVSW